MKDNNTVLSTITYGCKPQKLKKKNKDIVGISNRQILSKRFRLIRRNDRWVILGI